MTRLATAFIAATLAFTAPATAAPARAETEHYAQTTHLPACDSEEMHKALEETIGPVKKVFETTTLQARKLRWCEMWFVGPNYGLGANQRDINQKVFFFVEWVNESEGRYKLVIDGDRPCPGIPGDPSNMSRC